jgi:serine/threonine protein kinase
MLMPDPISRITCEQIKLHPWLSKTFSEFKFRTASNTINQNILFKCLDFPKLSKFSQAQAYGFIQNNIANEFTVSYNILLDFNSKNQDKPTHCTPCFGNTVKSNFTKPKKSESHKNSNWVYGFRCNLNARTLMEILFTALKDADLEWKILENFCIRVRPLVNPEAINSFRDSVKFDIRVYRVIAI